MKGISLHPSKTYPEAYTARVLSPGGGYFTQRFKFSDGGQEAALARALSYRDRLLWFVWGQDEPQKLTASPARKRKGTIYRAGRKGSTDALGVIQLVIDKGKATQRQQWVAEWREDGRVCRKAFGYDGQIGAARTRTSDEAKALAILCRQEMEDRHYK